MASHMGPQISVHSGEYITAIEPSHVTGRFANENGYGEGVLHDNAISKRADYGRSCMGRESCQCPNFLLCLYLNPDFEICMNRERTLKELRITRLSHGFASTLDPEDW
jgi:hypothetical protein